MDVNGWNILHDAVLGGHPEMLQHIVKLQPGKPESNTNFNCIQRSECQNQRGLMSLVRTHKEENNVSHMVARNLFLLLLNYSIQT